MCVRACLCAFVVHLLTFYAPVSKDQGAYCFTAARPSVCRSVRPSVCLHKLNVKT